MAQRAADSIADTSTITNSIVRSITNADSLAHGGSVTRPVTVTNPGPNTDSDDCAISYPKPTAVSCAEPQAHASPKSTSNIAAKPPAYGAAHNYSHTTSNFHTNITPVGPAHAETVCISVAGSKPYPNA